MASGWRSSAQSGDHRFVIGPEGPKGRTPLARRLTRLDFRDDETGHVGRRAHLWVVAAREGSKPRQLTSGDFDVTNPAWAPDGRRIAFSADRGPDANILPRHAALVGGDGCRAPSDPRAGEPGRRRGLAGILARRPSPGVHRHRRRRPAGRGVAGRVGHGSARGAAEAAHRDARPAGRRLGMVRPDDGRGGAGPGLARRRLARRGDRRPRSERSLPGRPGRQHDSAHRPDQPNRVLGHRGRRRSCRCQRSHRRAFWRGACRGERVTAGHHA